MSNKLIQQLFCTNHKPEAFNSSKRITSKLGISSSPTHHLKLKQSKTLNAHQITKYHNKSNQSPPTPSPTHLQKIIRHHSSQQHPQKIIIIQQQRINRNHLNQLTLQNNTPQKNITQTSHHHQLKTIHHSQTIGNWQIRKSVTSCNQTGMVMGMKVIPKSKIYEEKLLQQLISQLKIQAFLNHPHIIQLYGFYHDEDNFYILMELGCEGQLYSHMQNHHMSQQSTSYIIRSLLTAVEELHRYNIIHRDIKPQNIVVVHGNVKLCDFGWCVQIKDDLRTTYCGTPLYFSPEIIVGMEYDQKVDIWAIGILTYELMTGTTPFNIKQKDQLYKIVTQNVIFNDDKINRYSSYFKQFVKAILKKDPRDRLNCQKLLQMPFIKRYKQLETCQQLCRFSN